MTPAAAIQLLWIIWVVSWFAAAVWSATTVRRAGVGRQVAYRLTTVAGAILLFAPLRSRPSGDVLWRLWPPLAWTMAGVVACGFLFTWWARLHLGRLWSGHITRKEHHRVVDTGPYGLVRHPIYTGFILAALATAAVEGAASGWAGAALMTAGFYLKARVEEAFLREELGPADYDAYARRVPMLVPFARPRR